jgi:signal transduction histidine kinase
VKIWIVSSDAGFADTWAKSWQSHSCAADIGSAVVSRCGELPREAVIVLVDGADALAGLRDDHFLAIAIVSGEAAATATMSRPRVVQLSRDWHWAEIAAALAEQAVLRLRAEEQLTDLQRRMREAARFVAVGRYVIEKRHDLGNALTGVLGNSELVLLETEGMPPDLRGQLETIHVSALRICEILQRMSSLEMEMRMAEKAQEPGAGFATGN